MRVPSRCSPASLIATGVVAVLALLAALGHYDAMLALAPAGLLFIAFALGLYVGEERILRALARLRPRRRAARSLGSPRASARVPMASGRLMASGWAMRPPPVPAR